MLRYVTVLYTKKCLFHDHSYSSSLCTISINYNYKLPSGKHTKNYGTSHSLIGKSTISMAILAMFNSFLYVYQRPYSDPPRLGRRGSPPVPLVASRICSAPRPQMRLLLTFKLVKDDLPDTRYKRYRPG